MQDYSEKAMFMYNKYKTKASSKSIKKKYKEKYREKLKYKKSCWNAR